MNWLLERFYSAGSKTAFIHDGREVSYTEGVEKVAEYGAQGRDAGVKAGECVVVFGDYSPELFCQMLYLWQIGAIVLPLTPESVVARRIGAGRVDAIPENAGGSLAAVGGRRGEGGELAARGDLA
jgi:acyl-coenzyme A synthetase/AMP-(fatty) acid ligase